MKNRVVVTGYGLISPLGSGNEKNWEALMQGKSGIKLIPAERLNTEELPVKFAGIVDDFNADEYMDGKTAKRHELFVVYAIAASSIALKMSGLDLEKVDLNRCGTHIGSGIGGFQAIENTTRDFDAKGVKKISPFFIPTSIINMASGAVSIEYKFKGPNFSIVTACATGTHSIGEAARLIQHGYADVMLAGGTESAITSLAIGGFANMKALSRRNDDPEKASRPFDADRDGFVMGEGCGIMVLESYEHAVKRGATILAEYAGYGASADAYHITAPDETADGITRCMQAALDDAGIKAEEVGYINAHGTSTPFNDKIETHGIKNVFKENATKVQISSTKSMTGHLLGAAGAIEAIYSVMALEKQMLPPTINYTTPDPECDLNYVPNTPVKCDMKYALSNSLGFGGTNGTIIFKKYE